MAEANNPAGDNGIITKSASGSVDELVARLTDMIENRDLVLFAVVDHSGEAKGCGLELRNTKVVIFGSPKAGTPVMVASPLSALDLPLKVLIWDDRGQTKISYTDPDTLATRHHLSHQLAARLEGIGPLTDALAD
jgi:uncharacterized protein (DUF302 family)